MKSRFRRITVLFMVTLFLGGTDLLSPPQERCLDVPGLSHDEPTLVVFYPSRGSIKALTELRKHGLIPLENLSVIGIYHEKEKTDYEESRKYVGENNLDWFTFHMLSGELTQDTLFLKNALSSEFEAVFNHSDAVIFFGGPDIPPSIYSEKTNFLTHIEDPYRHYLELSMIFHLLGGYQDENFRGFLESRPEFPILGICLGAQSLNVGTGGTLVQDIWSETYGIIFYEDAVALGRESWHTNPHARLHPREKLFPYNFHAINFIDNARLHRVLGLDLNETPTIISAHHQQAGRLGQGFRVAAASLDGKVIEAIEHMRFPHVLGVQFHPEFPVLWDEKAEFRLTPQEKEGTNLQEFLKSRPPSLDFHHKLWSWFSQKILESHEKTLSKHDNSINMTR